MLNCWGCNHPISEARDTVFWDESVIPARAMCEACFEKRQQEVEDE